MTPLSAHILIKKSGLSVSSVASRAEYSPETVHTWINGSETMPGRVVRDLESLALDRGLSPSSDVQNTFSFIDLFAGIGGIRRGFESWGGRCVFTSELNKFSRQTYEANYPCDHEIAGDITKIDAENIPEHDLLLGGFPCQAFSHAGKKRGFEDPRGTLFFDIARILEHHRPQAFLLENVKNLVSHDKGRTFSVIRRVLEEELKYHISFRIIDARSWVPQHRERIYIAGFRDGCGFSFENFPIPDHARNPVLDSILHPEDGTENLSGNEKFLDASGKVLDKYTLSDKLWGYLKAYAKKHAEKGNGFGYSLFGPEDVARTLSARYYKDGSEILIRQDGRNPRRLTPRECSRLMGFDRPGESEFVIPVSDTQSYRQFGNAVAVPVIGAIAEHMLPWVRNGKGKPVLRRPYKNVR